MATVPGCDAPNPSAYGRPNDDGTVTYVCRCLVCGRCKKHTGSSTQGHYWAYCKVTREVEDFHFCCPGDCELHPPAKTCAVCGGPSGGPECTGCTVTDETTAKRKADR